MASTFATTYGPWAVITGASSGIGKAFATELASRGISTVLTARREDRLTELSNTLSNIYGVETRVIVADLSKEEGWRKIGEDTADLNVGCLIANAGVEVCGSYFRSELEEHLNVINVNVTAVASLTYIFGKRLAKRGRGGIILVSSISALPMPWQSSYGASKAFVSSLGVVVGDELKKKGVDVLVLEPGPVKTEMTDRASAHVDFEALGGMLSAEQCVTETLERFVQQSGGRFTPGWVSRLQISMASALPEWFRMWLGGVFGDKYLKQEIKQFE